MSWYLKLEYECNFKKGISPLCSVQTKLTHSFHGKITQTIKKRDFFQRKYILIFWNLLCSLWSMRSSIVRLFIELWQICSEYYIWLQIKRETLAVRTLMSSTLCQRVWYLIISAMQQKLSFMVWHLGARMMMTTACSRCFNIFLTVIVSKLFLFSYK